LVLAAGLRRNRRCGLRIRRRFRRAARHFSAAMATGAHRLLGTRGKRLRWKERSSHQQNAAQRGQYHLHAVTVVPFGVFRQTVIALYPSIFGVFVGCANFRDIFGRLFVKILFAARTAQFDLLALVHKNVRLAHFAQFLARYRASGQFIRLGRCGSCRVCVARQAGKRQGENRNSQRNGHKHFQFLHIQFQM